MSKENNENNELVSLYELAFHTVSKLTAEEAGKEFSNVKDLINKSGSKTVAESGPALIDLAYTISKAQESKYDNYNAAYFAWIKFESKPEQIAEIKESLDLNKNILRFLITQTELETATPVESFVKKQDKEFTIETPEDSGEEVLDVEEVAEEVSPEEGNENIVPSEVKEEVVA